MATRLCGCPHGAITRSEGGGFKMEYGYWHYAYSDCAGPFSSDYHKWGNRHQEPITGTTTITQIMAADRPPPITIAGLEAKIMRMRDEMKGGKVVAAIDAIHAGRRRILQWPEVK